MLELILGCLWEPIELYFVPVIFTCWLFFDLFGSVVARDGRLASIQLPVIHESVEDQLMWRGANLQLILFTISDGMHSMEAQL